MVTDIIKRLQRVVPGLQPDDTIEIWRNRMPEPDVTITVQEMADILEGADGG